MKEATLSQLETLLPVGQTFTSCEAQLPLQAYLNVYSNELVTGATAVIDSVQCVSYSF